MEFVTGKPVSARLGLAAQLKFFMAYGFFVQDRSAIPADGISYLAEQLGFDDDTPSEYDFGGRTARRHCAEILQYLGFRRLKRADREALTLWIAAELCPTGQSAGAMLDEVFLWCRDRRIYGPSPKELERLVRSQRQRYFDDLVAETSARLSERAVVLLEGSITDPDGLTGFNTMRGDAGQASLDNILGMTAKLAFIQRLDLPQDILATTGKAWLEQIVRRVAGEKAWEMRRHAPAKQIGLYAIYLSSRQAQLTDARSDRARNARWSARSRRISNAFTARNSCWSTSPSPRSTNRRGGSAMLSSRSSGRTSSWPSSRRARRKALSTGGYIR
uniref:DUF4158 domain-containing protein n=1 Tax=Sinorhizobium psoraleae TaxID=520838 RepID=UPI001FE2B48C